MDDDRRSTTFGQVRGMEKEAMRSHPLYRCVECPGYSDGCRHYKSNSSYQKYRAKKLQQTSQNRQHHDDGQKMQEMQYGY